MHLTASFFPERVIRTSAIKSDLPGLQISYNPSILQSFTGIQNADPQLFKDYRFKREDKKLHRNPVIHFIYL